MRLRHPAFPGGRRLFAVSDQGEALLSTTLVSTGLDPNATERGMFRVRFTFPVKAGELRST
jgi:hypothetical protein